MNKMADCPKLLYPYSSYNFDTMFCNELNDVNIIMNENPRYAILKYCWLTVRGYGAIFIIICLTY